MQLWQTGYIIKEEQENKPLRVDIARGRKEKVAKYLQTLNGYCFIPGLKKSLCKKYVRFLKETELLAMFDLVVKNYLTRVKDKKFQHTI